MRNEAKSAARALDVLEVFGRLQRPLRAIEIVRDLILSPSSVDQLLKTMTRSGYLMFDKATKLYSPSPRLVQFSSWVKSDCFGVCDIAALLKTVSEATGEWAVLTAQNDCSMQIVSYSSPVAWIGRPIGQFRIPLVGSICGAVRLAAYSHQEAVRVINRANSLSDCYISKQQALQEIEEVRELGYSSGDPARWEPQRIPLWALAVRVDPEKIGGASIIVGIGGPVERIRPHQAEMVRAMNEAIKQCCH